MQTIRTTELTALLEKTETLSFNALTTVLEKCKNANKEEILEIVDGFLPANITDASANIVSKQLSDEECDLIEKVINNHASKLNKIFPLICGIAICPFHKSLQQFVAEKYAENSQRIYKKYQGNLLPGDTERRQHYLNSIGSRLTLDYFNKQKKFTRSEKMGLSNILSVLFDSLSDTASDLDIERFANKVATFEMFLNLSLSKFSQCRRLHFRICPPNFRKQSEFYKILDSNFKSTEIGCIQNTLSFVEVLCDHYPFHKDCNKDKRLSVHIGRVKSKLLRYRRCFTEKLEKLQLQHSKRAANEASAEQFLESIQSQENLSSSRASSTFDEGSNELDVITFGDFSQEHGSEQPTIFQETETEVQYKSAGSNHSHITPQRQNLSLFEHSVESETPYTDTPSSLSSSNHSHVESGESSPFSDLSDETLPHFLSPSNTISTRLQEDETAMNAEQSFFSPVATRHRGQSYNRFATNEIPLSNNGHSQVSSGSDQSTLGSQYSLFSGSGINLLNPENN